MAKYTQDTIRGIKKGDKFTLVAFTGMNLGQYEVTAVSKKQFKTVKADGKELIFNRADGIQANAKDPKFANRAVDLMEEPESRKPKNTSKKKKKKDADKKVEKQELPENCEDFDGVEDDDDWEDA